MCLHWNGFWTLGAARSAKAERRHKSGASASRYANDEQNCGSAKHGAIHKVLYLIKKLGNKPFGLFPSSFLIQRILKNQTIPCAFIASTTFSNPAMFAPAT